MTHLQQPPGSDIVIACTAKRQLMMWRPNPGAAFRTFTARQTWYDQSVATHLLKWTALKLTTDSLVVSASMCTEVPVIQFASQLALARYVQQQAFASRLGQVQQPKAVLLLRFETQAISIPQ